MGLGRTSLHLLLIGSFLCQVTPAWAKDSFPKGFTTAVSTETPEDEEESNSVDFITYALYYFSAATSGLLLGSWASLVMPATYRDKKSEREKNIKVWLDNKNQLESLRKKIEEYPKAIEALEIKQIDLERALPRLQKARRAAAKKELRMIQAQLAELKQRSPMFEVLKRLGELGEIRNAETDLLNRLGSPKNLRSFPSLKRVLREWGEYQDAEGIRDWLESEEGQRFKLTEKAWITRYEELQSKAVASAKAVAESVNPLIEDFNRSAEERDRKPLIRVTDSPVGAEDRFLVHSPDPLQRPEPISRGKVGAYAETVCKDHLALLGKHTIESRKKTSLTYVWRNQIYALILGGAAAGSAYGANQRQKRKYNKSFDEMAAEEAKKTKQIEQAAISLAGQMETERVGQNRLQPFFDLATEDIHSNIDPIVDGLEASLSWSDRQNGLKSQSMRAIADGEDLKARLAANLQTVTWEQFTARGYTALPNVMELIYTEKQFVAQTTLKNYLTEIYRETIRRVFEGLADKDMMDHIEKVVLPELSEQTIRRLQDHVNKKRAITPADQIPSVPGLNVEVPKETKPVNGKHNEAAAPVNSNDETKAAISMPATPGAVAQSQPAPSLQLP